MVLHVAYIDIYNTPMESFVSFKMQQTKVIHSVVCSPELASDT